MTPRSTAKAKDTSSFQADSLPADSLVTSQPLGATNAKTANVDTQKLLDTTLSSGMKAALAASASPLTLRVLSLNTYFDSRMGLDAIKDLILRTEADLIGLQESNQSTQKLAESLGMHFLQQDKRTALLSRFPFDSVTPKKYGVAVTLDNGQKVGFLNGHLTSFPNQPHQLMHLPNGGGPYIDTEKEAVWWADKTRGREFKNIINEANAMKLPVVATGDFNEPSHLDWTEEAAAAKRHPIKVEWPGSKALEKAGFLDSYRVTHPDVMQYPGNTWTPTAEPGDPKTKHDRIDFVMYRGAELDLKKVEIVGESEKYADIVVTPYPSDHRAVLATFEVKPPAPTPSV